MVTKMEEKRKISKIENRDAKRLIIDLSCLGYAIRQKAKRDIKVLVEDYEIHNMINSSIRVTEGK